MCAMQCIEQASSCPQCENGYGWKLGKKGSEIVGSTKREEGQQG